MKKSNSGFTLIELLVVLACLAILSIYAANYFSQKQVINKNNRQINSVLDLRRLMQEYTYYHGIPDSLTAMVDAGYDFKCTSIATVCPHIYKTFWGDPITFNRGDNGKMNSLTLGLDSMSKSERGQFKKQFIEQLPTSMIKDKSVTYEFNLSSDKAINVTPGGGSFDDKGFLKQDGSRPLTNDWNVGNYHITNVADIQLTDGSPQRVKNIGIASNLVRTQGVAKLGDYIPMPSCRKGGVRNTDYAKIPELKPTIMTWIMGISPLKTKFSSISSFYARGEVESRHPNEWRLWTSFVAKAEDYDNSYGEQLTLFNDYEQCGYGFNNPYCKHADVLMGYMTFCRSERNEYNL